MVKQTRRQSGQTRQMRGGAADLKTTEITTTECTTAAACNKDLLDKQQLDGKKQIMMRNQAGGSQLVEATTSANASEEDAALQDTVQGIALQAQAQAEFDKCAGMSADQCGGKRKKRKSKKRKSKKRKSKKRKSKKRKSKKRKSKKRKSKKTRKKR